VKATLFKQLYQKPTNTTQQQNNRQLSEEPNKQIKTNLLPVGHNNKLDRMPSWSKTKQTSISGNQALGQAHGVQSNAHDPGRPQLSALPPCKLEISNS
jgi:hypothetical protein